MSTAPATTTAAPTAKAAKPKDPKYKLCDDLLKIPRDFMKKSFLKIGEWKFESKRRGPADTLYANPKLEDGVFSVDLQYDNTKKVPLATKLNLTTTGAWKLTTKSPFGSFGTLEVETTPTTAELTFDGEVKGVKVVDKVSTSLVEVVASYDVAKFSTIGAFGQYDLAKSLLVYGGAARYQDKKGYLASVFVTNAGFFGIAASAPFSEFLPKSVAASAFFSAEGEKFRRLTKKAVGVQLGFASCPYAPVVRAKLSETLEPVVAVTAKLAAGTTVALTLQRAAEAGVSYGLSITQE